MSDSDKMLHELDELIEPSMVDYLLAADADESYEPKRLMVEALVNLIFNGNASFKISDDNSLIMLIGLDANGKKLYGLAKATEDKDAVRYSQVRHLVEKLDGVVPAMPSVSDRVSFLRLATHTITAPYGGFYMFYWCVSDNENTQLTLEGGSVVASTEANVYFDGSVANVVNIPKSARMKGKYFHCAVRYRNSVYSSALSATSHYLVSAYSPDDLITPDAPGVPINPAVSVANNRLVIVAEKPENATVGSNYRFEILFDDSAGTNIQGNEPQLLVFYGYEPRFVYDLPLMQAVKSHVHVRVSCVSAYGVVSAGDTKHTTVSFDDTVFSESFMDYLALKISEKVQTQDGTPLTAK